MSLPESVGSMETCEPTYGFLPCSTNAWGLLFLIVVYEILLSIGAHYVAIGSELFFQITGPGIFGASLFQFLGTIPQIVLVLVSSLWGPLEAAQQRATMGVGLIAGTTVILLTLIWGSSVVLGSYDLSEAVTIDKSRTLKGYGVVTDVETTYTARIMLISLAPFLIMLLPKAFHSSTVKRVITLIALIITVTLLLSYILCQIFQPWIQYRRFEYLIYKYARNKLLRLVSRNGRPDIIKIQEMFNKIDKDKSGYVTASELRVFLLGVEMDNDDDLSKDRDVESILKSFDVNEDDQITLDEFMKGMNQLVLDMSEDQTPNYLKNCTSQGGSNSQLQQGLLVGTTIRRPSNSWWNYLKAFFYVTTGIVMLCALSQPLTNSVVGFAHVAKLSPFGISYVAIPIATNYRVAVKSIASSRNKSKKSISLTLSALYGRVYMNNVVGLIVFLAPVYARHLSEDVFAEIMIVVVICMVMTVVASLGTTFDRWVGYLVLLLYPVSLALIYLVTYVFGWH